MKLLLFLFCTVLAASWQDTFLKAAEVALVSIIFLVLLIDFLLQKLQITQSEFFTVMPW
jgi:hypothetical protein